MIHQLQIVARYAETDMMGVIHHSVYPIWAEASRTDLMKIMGYPYSQLEKSGIMLPVVEINFRYKVPTYYEDIICINSAVTHLDNRRFTVEYEICVNDKVCVQGYSKHIFMNSETRVSTRISSDLLDNFKQFYHPEFTKIS